jgi:hypothetical protein
MANVPISAFTVPANTVGIGATGYSLTGSASASFMDLAGTWNTSGTPTAIKLNITDTASNGASLLMDLQATVSGVTTSRFYVGKTGRANVFDLNCWDGDLLIYRAGTLAARAGTVSFSVPSQLALSNNNPSAPDLFLTRRGAANLRLGAADAAAPVAQTLSVQSVVAGTTNTAGTNLTITGSQGTGTGAGGSLIFQVAPAGSSGTAQNALATALQIEANGRSTFATSTSAATPTIAWIGETNTGWYRPAGGYMYLSISGTAVGGWGAGFFDANTTSGVRINTNGAGNAIILSEAANTLALRNGVNAQTFNVYNTFTDASNYERFRIFAQSGAAVIIGTEKLGTGVARDLVLQTDGTARLTLSNVTATFTGSVVMGGELNVGSSNIIGWGAGRAKLFAPTASAIRILPDSGDARVNFGGDTSSFPALKRSTTFLQVRLADDSAFAGFASANVQAATAYTVATLPTPATGMIARVTDATAPTIGSTVTGGGAAYALVNYNGANWTVIGV